MQTSSILYCFSFLFLLSCGTATVMVDVQRPADISVPQHIESVVIANRSTPEKSNIAENILEGILTGEGIGADKKGSEYCVRGLTNMLGTSDRYKLINSGDIILKGTGTSTFPDLLDWLEVQKICDAYGSDAIIVLSTFDSDSRIIEGKSVVKTKTIKGAKIKEVRYPVTLIMEIESGWRIYDASMQKIVDENSFTEVKEFNAWGDSYKDARSRLPSKRDALKRSGIFAGTQYGFRISPIWTRVSRMYFTGKHKDLKLAKKYVKTGRWEEAIELWKSLTKSVDVKIARRAYFNLALASEIRGQLDVAIEYADKSRQLGENRSNSYIRTLQVRKQDEEILRNQLKK